MKLQIIVILLSTFGITAGLAVIGDEQIFITVTSEGKAKISQSIFPETFVSTIDVKVISENISNLLAIDEENILLGTSQNQELLKIATLGASAVDLKYNADIISYESGVFRLKYNSDVESRVNLPPLSKLVSLNTIPNEITDEEYILPPGDISLSFSIRPVTAKEFFVPVDDSEYKVEAITAAKIEGFSANSDEIQFIIKDKAIVLTIIPTQIMANPNDALLNGEKVDFTQFHKNSTHSWIRIDPHEKGLVKILDTSEKTEENGGCLIATATYGTEMAPQVQLLREIRDNQLMNTDSGVSFMTGFNSLYYSFSPYVADLERENPFFKEIVKIGISPLLLSLSVMEYAETNEEIFGLGISVILMNIGMYFVFPFVICYEIMRLTRTRGVKRSSLVVISNCNVKSVLKIGLLGLIALFVLSVSVPSAFAQSTESETESPLKMVLDITYQNIVESITDSEMSQNEINLRLLQVEEEYNEAIDLINGDDIVAAKQDVVQTMGIFELIAEDIAESNPIPSQLTPGFGAGIDSASDNGITQGQGLGVGGVPPGIFNQISDSNTFAVSEAITSIDDEVDQYRELVKLNNLDDIDFGEFDESVNLAKTLLANGVVPDAQVKLELANQIKDDLLQKIQDAANENSAAEIEQYMDEQKNLSLTQKDIRELEGILEEITTEDIEETGDNETPDDVSDDSGDAAPGNSGDAPGNSGDETPGNSGDETPGFDSASDTGKANGQGNGLGLGNIPPGQFKKLDYSEFGTYSPDDYFDDATEDLREDSFEEKFDKMNKDSKSKEKKEKAKQAKLDRIADAAANDGPPGLAKKANDGITDGDSTNTVVAKEGILYTIQDFTAIKNGKDVTSNIKIDITMATGSALGNVNNGNQPHSFTPDVNGTYTVTAEVGGLTDVTRTISVGDVDAPPTLTGNIPDGSTSAGTNYVVDIASYFNDAEDLDTEMTYTGTDSQVSGQGNLVTAITSVAGTTTITVEVHATKTGVYDITIIATDTSGGSINDTFRLTIS